MKYTKIDEDALFYVKEQEEKNNESICPKCGLTITQHWRAIEAGLHPDQTTEEYQATLDKRRAAAIEKAAIDVAKDFKALSSMLGITCKNGDC